MLITVRAQEFDKICCFFAPSASNSMWGTTRRLRMSLGYVCSFLRWLSYKAVAIVPACGPALRRENKGCVLQEALPSSSGSAFHGTQLATYCQHDFSNKKLKQLNDDYVRC